VPIPAASEAESEAESVAPHAQSTRKGVTLCAVALVAALVVVGVATFTQPPGSAPAEIDNVAVTALEIKAEARKAESPTNSSDKDAWESALQSAGREGDVASEDGAGGAGDASLGEWSEESRQEVRDKLQGLQDKLNKAMDELNAKMEAHKGMSAEEASAEGQKRLEEWQAHPDAKQKRDEAVKASAHLQDVMAGLLEKRKQRLAAQEAAP